jgi:hypothetical protein
VQNVQLEIRYASPLVCHRSCTVATGSKIVVESFLDLHIIVESRIVFLFEVELSATDRDQIVVLCMTVVYDIVPMVTYT